ncbi:hypothetical protein RA280_30770 [Cupriavidus sp. CV2]|uniref:hypothetical protein n=1 Tax=Cupriavidus ulmosensis TaxID=3065913 RepID=UPI00296AA8CA|nr:hypothetical protein [Cupriavidus sp. CV2]MDW3686048.1 hypothetical protein [Cupriavidus sp. CV2]
MSAKRRSRNDPLLAAALLALNSQRKQGGGRANLVPCQAFGAQIAILFGGLSWVDCTSARVPRRSTSSATEVLEHRRACGIADTPISALNTCTRLCLCN